MIRPSAPDRMREMRGLVRRVGEHRGLWHDAYARLLHTSWRNVLLVFAACYLVGNSVFAGLYLLAGDAIENARPGSVLDAFSFSVQTMATIGYGALSPHGVVGNALVALESFLGLLALAAVTGVVFAKISRPRAGVLFSKKAVIAKRSGVPHLMFRVANERGSDLAEASIRLTALMNDVTPEGEVMRRLHDLHLVRTTTPVLLMSWQVMHPIDDHSPLFGLDAAAMTAEDLQIFASLTAIDGAYGQTVYAYHVYRASEVHCDARFVDVIRPLPNGQRELDLTKFHDVEPVAAKPPAAR